MTENNDWTLNFYYTDEIKFGSRQDEENSQEALKLSLASQKLSTTKKTVSGEEENREREKQRERRLLKPTPVLYSVYKYMYVKVISIAKKK